MWYLISIICGTVAHAFLYVALIKATGGSFFKNLLSRFKRKHSKNEITIDDKKHKVTYYDNLIKTN
jgi:hypothetical protein